MDTRYLRYILVLAETGNMTKAAQKLYITQPTLSQFLTKQEQEIGMPLFERTKGIYTLTSVGELYAEYARKVLSLTEFLENDIQRISNTSRIHVGTSSTCAIQMLTSILTNFHQYYPKVEVFVTDNNLRFMINSITKGDIDIAFVTAHTLQPFKNQSVELKKEEVVFAAPSSHFFCKSLSDDHSLTLTSDELWSAFKNTPFILQLKGSCIRYLIDGFFHNQEFNPLIACNISHALSICDMVSSNIGVGFIPISYAISTPKIIYFSLEPRLYRIHSIIYRKDLALGPHHRYLIDLAKKYAAENWRNF